MKCKKCNQENLEGTKYCVNCGSELQKIKKINNTKLFIIIASFLVVGTVLVSLFIMFYNTDKEIEKYIEKEEEEEIIEEENKDFLTNYYSSYKIKDDNKILNNYVLDFFSDYVKTKTYDTFIILKNPKIYIKDNKEILNKFEFLNENCIYLLVEDKNSKIYFQDYVEFVINDNVIYLYDNNELFELEKTDDIYERNESFYSLNLIEKKYSKQINDKIKEIEEYFSTTINSDERVIIEFNHEIIKDDNITHISYETFMGFPHSGASIGKNTISFITNTLRILNLKEFLEIRNIDFDDFKEYAENEWQKVEDRAYPLTLEETSEYYYKENKIYFSSQNEFEPDLEINLLNFGIEE